MNRNMNGEANVIDDHSKLFPREKETGDEEIAIKVNNHSYLTMNNEEEGILNAKRCTTFPRSSEVQDISLGNPTSEILSDKTTGVRRLQKRRMPQQQLQMPIKYIENSEGPCEKRPTLTFLKDHNPWMKYQKFKKEAEPGKTCLAYHIDSPGMVVAIKEYKTGGINKTYHLQKIIHPNIVNLLDAFEESKTLYLVYELMELSLEQLQSGILLKESDLAFISKEVSHS